LPFAISFIAPPESRAISLAFSHFKQFAVSQCTSFLHITAEKLFVALHKISTRPVGVGQGIIRLQADGLVKILVSNPPVVVEFGILRLQADGLIEIINGMLILTEVIVSISLIVVGFG
jgi:hypothetical protein